MSFTQWQSFYNQLENDIKSNKYTFYEVMSLNKVGPAIKQRFPNLISFITNHFKDLIDCAFSKNENDVVNVQSLAILLENDHIRAKLSKNPEFINYIIQKIGSDSVNDDNLLMVLKGVIDLSNGLVLNDVKEPEKFIKMLIMRIDKIHYYEFLIKLFNDPIFGFIKYWLDCLKADIYLYEMIEFQEIFMRRAFVLLSYFIKYIQHNKNNLNRILDEKKISEILEIVLNAPTSELANSGFNYILSLTKSFNSEEIEPIMPFLEDKLSEFISYIKKDKRFFEDKKYVLGIISFLIEKKDDIDNDVFDFIFEVFNMFINSYTNSFLHLSFLELFKVLYKFESSFCLFITKNDIMNILLDKLNDRYKINACYWGQINEMVSLINDLIQKGKLKTSDRWEKYINGDFAQRKAILEEKNEESTKLILNNINNIFSFHYEEEEDLSSDSSDLESEEDSNENSDEKD